MGSLYNNTHDTIHVYRLAIFPQLPEVGINSFGANVRASFDHINWFSSIDDQEIIVI